MIVIDITQPIKNQKVAKGTILLLQGIQEKAINIIHSGMAELLSNSKIRSFDSPDDILAGSRRVGFVKGESIYGLLDIRSKEPYNKSVRALTDCIISVMPISTVDIFNKLKGNIILNLKILRALIQRIDSGEFLLTSYKSLWHNLNKIAVSIALAAKIPEIESKHKSKGSRASLLDYSAFLKNRFDERQLPLPQLWDPNVFLGSSVTRLDELDLPNSIDKVNIEDLLDYKQFLFFKRFLRMKDELLTNIVRNDEPMTFYIYQFLSDTLQPLIEKNEELANIIFDLIDTLFSDDGWICQVIREQGLKNKKAVLFNHYMSKFCWQFRKEINQLMGLDLKTRYPVYSNLQYYNKIDPGTIAPEENQKPQNEEVRITINENALAKFTNLLPRILEFADVKETFSSALISNLAKFKEQKKKYENIPQLNALKKRISQLYWHLYEKCFLKVIDTGLKNFIPGIMLHFGVLDEALLSREHLVFLDNAFSKNLYVDTPIPVMTLPYFLEKIFKDEIKPSISEMGQSFQDVLKKQEKASRKENEDFFSDTVEDRVKYEIRKVITTASKMIFGSIATAFPILCSDAIAGKLDQLFLEPETLAEMINSYRQRDFSMFYRDIVIHMKYGSEIVHKEVLPDFVLYPSFGSRMLMWQELDGARRDTKGRAFLPVLFQGETEKTMLTIIGHFRWELQRIIAGANWMDPVEGGLAGAYYDYITFYKKNPNLTITNKEKLKEFVKKTRSDKERFTSDYMTWILSEYEGMPKLTNVARDIFYRYCPFPVKDREKLSQRPAFSNLEMKYQNIVKKNILRMESRIKKYEKSGVPVPRELISYLNFLKK